LPIDALQSLSNEIKHHEHRKHRADFQKESIQRKLASMTEDELALWQDEYPPNSPQYILVQHEWNRRLTAEQVKATRYSAIITLFATIVGTLLGAALTIGIQWLADK
jgi:hypothetical protein